MKLYKALKLKKSLAGEIAALKKQIKDKNSYLVGSKNALKYNVNDLFVELQKKIDELVGLKFAINEANKEIQAKIYVLGEYKALIAFLGEIDVTEGNKSIGFGDRIIQEFNVQMGEIQRDQHIKDYQKRVDAIQEEIDTYNYTIDIPWDNALKEA